MANRVAVVGVNQLAHEDIVEQNLREAHYHVAKGLLEQVGMK
ncbi:MAG: hypothetical protein V3V88_01715 [Dehalococcoidia bacterium]|jgi:hypothetical protein